MDSLGLAPGARVAIKIGGKRETIPFLRTYGDVAEGEPLCFVASTGRVEIALNQASAAERFDAGRGAPIEVTRP
jgi:S-adenosylmethionine hydrolase